MTVEELERAREAMNNVNDPSRFMLFSIRQNIKDLIDEKIAEISQSGKDIYAPANVPMGDKESTRSQMKRKLSERKARIEQLESLNRALMAEVLNLTGNGTEGVTVTIKGMYSIQPKGE